MKYAFIRDHRTRFRVRPMCRVLGVHASGFYAWLKAEPGPVSIRRNRLSKLARQSWLESSGVYGFCHGSP